MKASLQHFIAHQIAHWASSQGQCGNCGKWTTVRKSCKYCGFYEFSVGAMAGILNTVEELTTLMSTLNHAFHKNKDVK